MTMEECVGVTSNIRTNDHSIAFSGSLGRDAGGNYCGTNWSEAHSNCQAGIGSRMCPGGSDLGVT